MSDSRTYPPTAATLDDRSYLEFTMGLRAFALGDLNRTARTAVEGVLTGETVSSVGELREKADPIPAVAMRNRVLRSQQEMTWRRARESGLRREAELRAALQEAEDSTPDSLTLEPGLVYPEYLDVADIHLQPGSYEKDDLAGYVYHLGTDVFYAGRNEDDKAKRAGIARIPVPEDGEVTAILDLACSIGQSTTALKERFPEACVTGIDIAAPMLRYAHLRAVRLGVDVDFRQESAAHLSFSDASFDLVYCNILFHELPRSVAEHVVVEAARVLRPGGLFVVVDFAGRDAAGPFDYLSYTRDVDTVFNGEPFASKFVHSDFAGLLGRHFREVDPDALPDPTGIRHVRRCVK
ncbi:class I SAM-dependent methyltransferase [Streptomyces sp. NPDC052042]|uniref:class I SAM-dependent methyltransferase n=1 Tax=Streptomyces sp. NPDC052042 TaxID=3365683 RepID=UPI0037D7F694